MSEYPQLRSILSAAFSVETGLSDAGQTEMLKRALQSNEWRAKFRKELLSAANDAQTSWRELLFNDNYEVSEAESETEAREIAMSLLWNATFPDEPVPEL